MAVNLSFIGGAGWQFLDNLGNPLSGGKIYTYASGTTTPQATYTSRTGLIANTNPIILDAAGRTPEQIWSTEGLLYKYVVADSSDNVIRTWDNIGGSVVASDLAANLANTSNNSLGDALVGFKQNNGTTFLTGATARTVNAKLTEWVSVKDFGAVGDGITNDTAAFNAALSAVSGLTQKPVVFVPAGNYVLDPITIPTRVVLAGPDFNTPDLNTDGALLSFESLTTNQKAITLKAETQLKNLTINGPGKSVAGSYGIYTGATRAEADANNLGSNVTLINIKVQNFNIGAIITRWINEIRFSSFRENNVNLQLNDTCNDTQVFQCWFGGPSSGSNRNVKITALAGSKIGIRDCIFEPNLLGIEILGGDEILIDNNYFEITNSGFIDQGSSGTVVITNNFMYNNPENASALFLYGINCISGFTYIEGNWIGPYDSGTNKGTSRAIRFAGNPDDFKGAYIGLNTIGAYDPLPNFGIDRKYFARIFTPFTTTNTCHIVPGSTITNQYFNIPSLSGNIVSAGFIRQVKWYVVGTLDADITNIRVGRLGDVNVIGDFVGPTGFTIATTDIQGSGDVVADAEYNTNATVFSLGSLERALYLTASTTATTGSALVTVEMGQVRFYNIAT